MKEPIISVSGLRGIIGESLTPEVAARFACAFSAGLPAGPMILTRDGRTTGPMLSDAIRAGLCAAGRDVLDAGIAATPTTGVLVQSEGAVGGIQISASHNPPPYNGLKLFDRSGKVIDADAGAAVIERYRGRPIEWVSYDRIGHCRSVGNTTAVHRQKVLATVDVAGIRKRQFRVLLDSNHGAGSILGRELLDALGCEARIVGDAPDGHFEHPPEPTAENLRQISSEVTQFGASVGFCQDPDADRLAIIDETGHYIGEEFTLALCLNHVLQRQPGPVVTNCSTSRMAEDLAKRYRVPFFRSKVGEANVVREMQLRKAVFGGEGNGGPIHPLVGYVRDSFVGMALVLDAMASTGKSVGQLAAELPQYAIYKDKTTLEPERVAAAIKAVQSRFKDAKPDLMDGLRLDWPDRWLLIRASNTEPIVRVIAEAPTEELARGLCRDAINAMT